MVVSWLSSARNGSCARKLKWRRFLRGGPWPLHSGSYKAYKECNFTHIAHQRFTVDEWSNRLGY